MGDHNWGLVGVWDWGWGISIGDCELGLNIENWIGDWDLVLGFEELDRGVGLEIGIVDQDWR